MQIYWTIALALATSAFAAPSPDEYITARAVTTSINPTKTVTSAVKCVTSTYNPKISTPPTFTNATCTISKALTPGQPLSCAFPAADAIGKILGPKLQAALGKTVIADIDKVAEDLCISAVQDKGDGNGLCDDTLQLVKDIAVAKAPQAADKYRCLLNLLCIAHASPNNPGTCQFLLAGVDCVANRIINAAAPECPGTGA